MVVKMIQTTKHIDIYFDIQLPSKTLRCQLRTRPPIRPVLAELLEVVDLNALYSAQLATS